MATPMQLIPSLRYCKTLTILLLIHHFIIIYSKTLDSDIMVLRSIKQSIDPNSISSTSFLNTWDFSTDPCETPGAHFLGILCTIPEDNSSSSRVTEIDLEGDELEGFLTPLLGNLTEITLLNLRKNKFRGPIPSSITSLKKMNKLFLSDNFFSGRIPRGFSSMKRLEIVDLSQNRLSGSIPESVSSLRGLTQLSLSNNEISGRIPDLTGLWQLKTLDLSRNQLYGNIPQLPTSLRSLFLGKNLLSGHITPVNRLKHLRILDLSDNRLSGPLNKEIFTLPEVTLINVSANEFTSVVMIKMFDRPSQLMEIEAQGNRIRGHLPRNLVTYDNLTSVNLGHNLFSGEIPLEYGRRVGRGWKSLFLDYNMLEGRVPSWFHIGGDRFRGSLAHNCLDCPRNMPVCDGGQRLPSTCMG